MCLKGGLDDEEGNAAVFSSTMPEASMKRGYHVLVRGSEKVSEDWAQMRGSRTGRKGGIYLAES